MERPEGIEPSPKVWRTLVLPLNYGRIKLVVTSISSAGLSSGGGGATITP